MRPPFAAMLIVLVGVGAVEQQLVDPGLPFDDVVAVARLPLERVVAGAEKGDVVAVVAEHEVVAVAAEKRVGALAGEDRVVAGRRRRASAGRSPAGSVRRDDGVVAAEAVEA